MIDDFEALKRRVDDATRRRDMAAGELAAAEARLLAEFGCKDIAAAKRLLAKLETEERGLAVEYADARAAFDVKFGAALNGT